MGDRKKVRGGFTDKIIGEKKNPRRCKAEIPLQSESVIRLPWILRPL